MKWIRNEINFKFISDFKVFIQLSCIWWYYYLIKMLHLDCKPVSDKPLSACNLDVNSRTDRRCPFTLHLKPSQIKHLHHTDLVCPAWTAGITSERLQPTNFLHLWFSFSIQSCHCCQPSSHSHVSSSVAAPMCILLVITYMWMNCKVACVFWIESRQCKSVKESRHRADRQAALSGRKRLSSRYYITYKQQWRSVNRPHSKCLLTTC